MLSQTNQNNEKTEIHFREVDLAESPCRGKTCSLPPIARIEKGERVTWGTEPSLETLQSVKQALLCRPKRMTLDEQKQGIVEIIQRECRPL